MKNNEKLPRLKTFFQNQSEESVTYDEDSLTMAYEKHQDKPTLQIKILSIFGGVLASVAFIGFLFMAGLYNSETGMILIGGIFIAGSVGLNKLYDKIIFDTVSVSFFIIGFILIGFGLAQKDIDENHLCLLFMAIALIALIFTRNYIISFVSLLIISGSILTLILINENYNLIHVFVSVLAVGMTFLFLNEARIITSSKALSKLYNPLKIGTIFSFFAGLILLGKKGLLPLNYEYNYLASIVLLLLIIYVLSHIVQLLNITEIHHKVGIYILCMLLLLPTVLSPAISGSLLILLLSFRINYKTGFAIGIIGFIYFIAQFYYDLNFTLLTKSILLMISGILFIGLYIFTHKKLSSHEEI